MANVRLPTWLHRIAKKPPKPTFIELPSPYNAYNEEHYYWNEQAIRFGFCFQHSDHKGMLECNAKSLLLQKYFELTLRKHKWDPETFTHAEKSFFQEWGSDIEVVKIVSPFLSVTKLQEILTFTPHIKQLFLVGPSNIFKYSERIQLEQIFRTLPSIKKLHISDIQHFEYDVTEILPQTLTHLEFSHIRILAKSFFKGASSLHNLESVHVRFCQELTNLHINAIPKWVTHIDLTNSSRSLSRDCLLFLPPHLESCTLNYWHHISEKDIYQLPKSIQELYVDGCAISQRGLSVLSRFENLKTLSMKEASDHEYIECIDMLPRSLCYCDLSANTFNAHEFVFFKNFTELHTLILEKCRLSTSAVPKSHLPLSLRKLVISGSEEIKNFALYSIPGLCKLQELVLSGCNIKNHELASLPRFIKSLDLSLSHEINDTGLENCHELLQLETLILDRCQEIRGACLHVLPYTLKSLSFLGCHRLSGKSLKNLPRKIQNLNLSECELVESKDLLALPQTLQHLVLSQCRNIDNSVFEHIATQPLLHTVHLEGCHKIDEVGLRSLMASDFMGTVHIGTSKQEIAKIKKVRAKIIENTFEIHPPLSVLKKTIYCSVRKPKELATVSA